jgi:hypothetical protein
MASINSGSELTRTRDVPTMVRTLVGSRFQLETVRNGPSYLLFECRRVDEFGVPIPYTFVLCDGPLDRASARAIEAAALRQGSHLMAIGEDGGGLPEMSWTKFLARCGGAVKSWLPLEPEFADHLGELGHNRRIAGLEGRPDDLFEEYAQAGLQFLLADRVVRYGQDRRFERLPDGIAFARNGLIILYDAKAYAAGYPVSTASVRP